MKTTITAQQTAFFTKNGYIEFEIEFPPIAHTPERDLWRKDPELQNFLVRKLSHVAFVLTGKKQLRLGCDQWFAAKDLPKKMGQIKELLSVQGLALGVIIAENPELPAKRSPLGILPLPSQKNQILFFRPDLILDWPHVKSDLYLAIYTLPNAVYVYNSKDPFTTGLKQYGYCYGDVLKNEFHPLLVK